MNQLLKPFANKLVSIKNVIAKAIHKAVANEVDESVRKKLTKQEGK